MTAQCIVAVALALGEGEACRERELTVHVSS